MDEITTSEETTSNKIEIELEKLKIIADYYDLPLAVFFMSVDELKELKTKEGSRMRAIRKELEKLEDTRELETRVKAELEYPEKWDTVTYPTVWHALWEAYWWRNGDRR